MKISFIKKIFAICVLVVLIFGCHPFENKKIPDELLGEWMTTEPRYADCVLKFTDGLIIFGNGQDYLSVNYIVDIKKVCKDQIILYTIRYENASGLKYTFPVLFGFKNKEGVLRFKNQDHIIWTKRDGLL